MEKPDVDAIEGLSPPISTEQKSAGDTARYPVGTITEVYDYLRLLWARLGTPHCPKDGSPIERQSASQITDLVLAWPEGTKLEVLAPLVRGRKGEFRDVFEAAKKQGFVRVRVDGETHDLSDAPKLNRRQNHDVAVVVDRLVVRKADRARLADSIETALKAADGTVEIVQGSKSTLFSERYACPTCGLSLPELEPRQFSFNSPFGACPDCSGLGTRREVNADLVLGDPSLSILEGVILPWGEPSGYLRKVVLPTLARAYKFDLPVTKAVGFFEGLPLRGNGRPGLDPEIAGPILKEVKDRLRFLNNVGLDYLTLGRAAESLSGGEAQRIRLATQIGSRLVGVLYILDEPSIGLHQRDNTRLLATLEQLRDLGNTVIVVEHDEETMRAADHLIDMGPGAGKHGGEVIGAGTVDEIIANPRSITGKYLSGEEEVAVPGSRRPIDPKRAIRI